jgi:CTP synthase
MVIEFARNEAGLGKADSTEFDPDSPEPVIVTMEEQLAYVEGAGDLGGTMRLGLYPAVLKPGSIAREVYGAERIDERHRHRYEVNNDFRDQLVRAGLVISGTFQGGRLVEIIELPDHPWFVASQFHPEFKSRPTRPAPLFREFVGAAAARAADRTGVPAVTRA